MTFIDTSANEDLLFEKQFAEKKYLNTSFGKIETVDILPEKLIEKTPLLLAPGWGESLPTQKAVIKELYLSGRYVLALRHTFIIKRIKNDTNFPLAQLQKAQTLLALLRERHVKKVDAISHSEGAINLTIAATMQPELFRNLILVTPAGVSGKDMPIRIIIGFLRHVIKTRKHLWHLVNNTKKPPYQKEVSVIKKLTSFYHEITSMASFDIHPLLINLRKHNVKIAILAGKIDTAFPLKRMRKHLEKGIVEYNLQTEEEKKHYGLDIFATKKDGHEFHANSHEVVKQVLSLLRKLK